MIGTPKVRCPSCGSTQIAAVRRGFKLSTGWMGSGQVILNCMKCGRQFRPGQTGGGRLGLLIFLIVILVVIYLMMTLFQSLGI